LSLTQWKRRNSSKILFFDIIKKIPNFFSLFRADQTIIEQGEAGDCLFIVETGELNCYKKFVKNVLKIKIYFIF
jgi:hypothetical protein